MDDLEQRVKELEHKVKVLEETLSTLKNMQLSEQMKDYLDSKTKTLKMMSLLNSVSEESENIFDTDAEEKMVASVSAQKATVDEQITASVKYVGSFSDDMPDDPRYFEYEIEKGTVTKSSYSRFNASQEEPIEGLSEFARKGLRITAYNGFDSNRIVVPKEIDGMPVISIGVEAFKNASFSEIILPTTIKAILESAFKGCSNLRKVDLPDDVRFIGQYSFSNSGVKILRFPNSIKKIERSCCAGCEDLEMVELGKNITCIDEYAFARCYKLEKINLPEKLVEIHDGAFAKTNLKALILPEDIITVSMKVFIDITNNNNNRRVDVAVKGRNTVFGERKYESTSSGFDSFSKKHLQQLSALMFGKTVGTIYCLPGSEAQQFARLNNIPIKPLNEFRMEDYQ